MIQVEKRNGDIIDFDPERIKIAITKANNDLEYDESPEMNEKDIEYISSKISEEILSIDEEVQYSINVEEIQDIVERTLSKMFPVTAKKYILYRERHRMQRDAAENLMKMYDDLLFTDAEDMDLKRDNANVNTQEPMGIMLKLGAEGAKSYCKNYIVPKEFIIPHKEGITHIHDLDFSLICPNCLTINLGKLFKGGFSTGHGHLREPGSIRAAASLACIAIQSNQNQMLGGQAIGAFDFVMAPYVHKSFQKHLRKAIYSYNKLLNTVCGYTYALENPDYYKEFKDKCEEYLKTFNEIRYYEENNSTKRNIMASKLSSLYVGRKLEDFKKVYEIACKELEDETHQAMEALVHNFNTLVNIGAA